LLLLLLLAYGWLFVFFPKINNPNELVRIYAARALVEEHSWSIGRRTRFGDRGPVYSSWGYVNDKALVCDDPALHPPACEGRLYAAKAPGATVLAVPVVAALRMFGPVSKDAAVFALRWIWMILPSVAFWLLLRRCLLDQGCAADVALAVTLAGGMGSLSLTYGQMFAGHQLAALALGAAWLSGFWKCRPALVGFFAALSVALEYPSAPAAALLCAAFVAREPRRARGVVLGALPWIAVVIQFHWSAFGAPWSTPYSHLENASFAQDIAPGFMGISLPSLERIYGSLFAPWLGLLFWAPWIAFAFVPRRTVPFAVVAYYVVFQITHALWRSGWVVGPRYITPLVPFAALCAAATLRQRPRLLPVFCGLAAAGIAATGLASAVCQGFPLEVQNPLREVVWPLLSHGWVPRNPLQLAGVSGPWSALPYFAALAVAIAVLLRRNAVAVAVAAAVTAAQWAAPASDERGAARFLAEQWAPPRPPGASSLR
jgi:hypothetical protein